MSGENVQQSTIEFHIMIEVRDPFSTPASLTDIVFMDIKLNNICACHCCARDQVVLKHLLGISKHIFL